MLSSKSVLTVQKNDKTYTLTCDPDSNILDVQAALYEMGGFVQAVIQRQAEQAALAAQVQVTEGEPAPAPVEAVVPEVVPAA